MTHRGQRTRGGVGDVRAGAGRELQRQRHCHRLIVVEQQRWHLGAGFEPVAAVRAFHGHHGITELAQPVDVAAHGAQLAG